MATEKHLASGKQFAADLRRLREERGLSIAAVHEETKIPRPLIEEFEASGLFDHPVFNRVYLRSFVRTYADLLGIAPEEALRALDEALDDKYEGRLAEIRPGEKPSEEPPAAERTAPPPGEDSPATPEAPAEQDPEPAKASMPEEEEAGQAWTAQSPPGGSSRSAAGRSGSRGAGSSLPFGWTAVLAGLLVLAAVVFFLIRVLGGEADAEREAVAPADTSAAAGEEASAQPPRANLSLGETMHFTVLAARGNVRPIRITRDSDLRRPYWIEQGQATVFPAEERIILEQQLDSIRLFLEGYEYPVNRRDEQGRIVITRQAAQAFADTVRGQPVNLGVQPDTNRIPAPR